MQGDMDVAYGGGGEPLRELGGVQRVEMLSGYSSEWRAALRTPLLLSVLTLAYQGMEADAGLPGDGSDAVADVRLPWQTPLPPERRTPARVRRGFSHLLAHLGSPANVPKPCGRSPGRPKGKRSPPARRFPAVKLTP